MQTCIKCENVFQTGGQIGMHVCQAHKPVGHFWQNNVANICDGLKCRLDIGIFYKLIDFYLDGRFWYGIHRFIDMFDRHEQCTCYIITNFLTCLSFIIWMIRSICICNTSLSSPFGHQSLDPRNVCISHTHRQRLAPFVCFGQARL